MIKFLIFASLLTVFGLQSSVAQLPLIELKDLTYNCSLEVSLNFSNPVLLKNFEKQFILTSAKTTAMSTKVLFEFSSGSGQWSHYCENCSGQKEVYNGQVFNSDVEFEFMIVQSLMGVNLMWQYSLPGGYVVSHEAQLFTNEQITKSMIPLPDDVFVKLSKVKAKDHRMGSRLFCKTASATL